MGRPRDNRGSAGGTTVPRSTHNRGFRLALTGLSGSPYGVGTIDASTSGFTSAEVVCALSPSSSPSFVAAWLVVVTTVILSSVQRTFHLIHLTHLIAKSPQSEMFAGL